MKIQINIEKKYFFIIIAVIVVVAAIVGVIAYGTNDPPVFGHSGGEVDVTIEGETKTLQQAIGPDIQRRVSGTCSAGSSIRVINQAGGVTCETDNEGPQGDFIEECRICVRTGDQPCDSGSWKCTGWAGDGDGWMESPWSITDTLDCVQVRIQCRD